MRLTSSLLFATLLLLLILPVFGHLDHLPIQLWDESRLALNAVEMLQNGNWLVTHFVGMPDTWNTKPPFLIWMQVMALKLFGLNELAIRLPVAIATLLTCCMLFYFFAKKTARPLLGLFAALILITAPGYTMLHGTRTGDYDGMLCLFTTAYALSFFLYLDEGKSKYLYAMFVLLSFAVLTKGVAGMLLAPALFLYAVYRKKLMYIFGDRAFYLGLATFLLLAGGYYVLREQAAPGYLQAVWENELGGRYAQTQDGHSGDFWFNIDNLRKTGFALYCILLIPGFIIGIASGNVRVRDLSVLSLLLAGSLYLVLGFGATKLPWYDIPAYPFMAIPVALALYRLAGFDFDRREEPARYRPLPLLTAATFLIFPYIATFNRIADPLKNEPYYDETGMAFFMKEVLHNQRNIDGHNVIWHEDYRADLHWYKIVFEHQKRDIIENRLDSLKGNEKVVVFKQKHRKDIEALYVAKAIDSTRSVTIYQLTGKRNLPDL